MLELAIWLYHIGTPDLTVRIATDVAIALCPDCRMVYESRYREMMEKFIKEGAPW